MKDTLPITGGKGSIGNAVLHEFLDSINVKEIKNLSRDEKKQDDNRRFYKNPKINII
jgi:UDP-N-acetylglucosamine 4,6-dehydratase